MKRKETLVDVQSFHPKRASLEKKRLVNNKEENELNLVLEGEKDTNLINTITRTDLEIPISQMEYIILRLGILHDLELRLTKGKVAERDTDR